MTDRMRDPFADDVLERLARSHQQYQREHGHYIVPLAERLLAARAERDRLREALARIRRESTYRGPDRLRTIAREAMEASDRAQGRG